MGVGVKVAVEVSVAVGVTGRFGAGVFTRGVSVGKTISVGVAGDGVGERTSVGVTSVGIGEGVAVPVSVGNAVAVCVGNGRGALNIVEVGVIVGSTGWTGAAPSVTSTPKRTCGGISGG